MRADLALQVAALAVLLAGAETLHGIARTVLVVPRIGKARALPLSALTGSLLALLICWWRVPGLGLRGSGEHLLLGLGLAAFMAAFDLAMARWLLRRRGWRLLADFDPRSGNLLVLGLLALVLIPWLVMLGHPDPGAAPP